MKQEQVGDFWLKKEARKNIPMRWFLEYEIRNSWIASWVSWQWAQNLLAEYYARKVARKYRKFTEL